MIDAKGKLAERQGRKATGLRREPSALRQPGRHEEYMEEQWLRTIGGRFFYS